MARASMLVLVWASSSVAALRVPAVTRRAAVGGALASSLAGLPVAAVHAAGTGGVPEGMKTSESYTNLQQISPETTGTLGAGTMSSRSRPVTGVVLLEEVAESGKKDSPTVSAEVVLDGGIAATITFDSEYPLIRGMFYDVEVKGKAGDSAFLQVAKLPDGQSIADVSDKFITKNVFSTEGRFGAYGSATDIKVLSSEKGAVRYLDVAFSALSPGQTEVPRRALVAALQPEGSPNIVMLVGSSTSGLWKKVEPAQRRMAQTFKVARVRKTSLARKSKTDYRFEEQGGLMERSDDSVKNLIAAF